MKIKKAITVLFNDADVENTRLVSEVLGTNKDRYNLVLKENLKGTKEYLSASTPDVVISAMNLPDGKATDLLAAVEEVQRFPIIVTSSQKDELLAVDVIKAGALDFVVTSEAAFRAMPRIIGRVLRDWEHIVKQREAERKIIASERKYRTFFEGSKDAIFICSTGGKFLAINPAGFELFGFETKDEIAALDISSSLCVEPERWNRLIQILNQQEFVKDFKIEMKKKNEAKLTVLITSVIIREENGNISGYSGIMRDITKQIHAEKKILEMNLELMTTNKRLKEAQSSMIQQEKLASIGQLAAGVAHELNNPLGFVFSNFVTLKRYIKTLLKYIRFFENLNLKTGDNPGNGMYDNYKVHYMKEKKANKIDFIIEDTEAIFNESMEGFEQMRTIVENLRSFSRVDYENKICEYDLIQAIESTLVVARNELKYSAVVEKNFSEIPLIRCKGDEINQVLLNIVVNAAQAIGSQEPKKLGKIKIETFVDNDYVYCKISDDGPGIPQELQQKIFDPFFTTKESGKGTGLGLNICHDIIFNKHKGSLTVESEVGKGSAFTIKLPIDFKDKKDDML